LRNFAHFVHAAHEIPRFRENIFHPPICPFRRISDRQWHFLRGANFARADAMPQSIDLKNVRCARNALRRAAWLQAA
jgi:hypothetical protein